jgi:hypothetical protein
LGLRSVRSGAWMEVGTGRWKCEQRRGECGGVVTDELHAVPLFAWSPGLQRINALKAGIEQRRVQRGVAGVADGEDAAAAAAAAEAEEAEAKRDMEAEKGRYKASFERLRNLKKEIEHLQLLLEQSRQKLQGDFEKWCVRAC